jgi:ABC-2 type transport system ATP-binding protein
MSDKILEVNNLKLKYPGSTEFAVNDLSFNLERGEIYGLLGPNGAGKTSAINIMTGLLKSDNGILYIGGNKVNGNFNSFKSKIGVVPQDIALFSNLTVKDNLLIIGYLYGLRKIFLHERINILLRDYGLSGKANDKVRNLSGGMTRRLNILAALLHSPELLFLDEPTAGIDVQSKNFILSNLLQLNKDGVTILYTSHYMDEAEKFCSRIGIIDKGTIIASETPKNLIENHPGCSSLEDVFLMITGRKIRE